MQGSQPRDPANLPGAGAVRDLAHGRRGCQDETMITCHRRDAPATGALEQQRADPVLGVPDKPIRALAPVGGEPGLQARHRPLVQGSRIFGVAITTNRLDSASAMAAFTPATISCSRARSSAKRRAASAGNSLRLATRPCATSRSMSS